MTDDVRVGDFVLMRRPDAGTVGLVYRIEGEKAWVWWREQDRPDGTAQVIDATESASQLRIVDETVTIPASMIRLHEENFPRASFRARRRT